MSKEKEEISRRRFFVLMLNYFAVALSALVVAWPLLRFVFPPKKSSTASDWVQVASTSEVPPLTAKSSLGTKDQPILVINVGTTPEENKYVALSKVCTHLACLVDYKKSDIECPCHGGKFDLDGGVISGPPPRPLQKYLVQVRQDKIFVGGPVSG